MALAPREPTRVELEAADVRAERLSVELAIDPPFVPRVPNASIHGDYLEAAHESTQRTLSVIHMRLANGDIEGATELVAKLRAHVDVLWEQRKEAAVRGVRP